MALGGNYISDFGALQKHKSLWSIQLEPRFQPNSTEFKSKINRVKKLYNSSNARCQQ